MLTGLKSAPWRDGRGSAVRLLPEHHPRAVAAMNLSHSRINDEKNCV